MNARRCISLPNPVRPVGPEVTITGLGRGMCPSAAGGRQGSKVRLRSSTEVVVTRLFRPLPPRADYPGASGAARNAAFAWSRLAEMPPLGPSVGARGPAIISARFSAPIIPHTFNGPRFRRDETWSP